MARPDLDLDLELELDLFLYLDPDLKPGEPPARPYENTTNPTLQNIEKPPFKGAFPGNSTKSVRPLVLAGLSYIS